MSRILKWIDERWPLTPFIRLALEEDMSGGAGYAYVFGSSALIIFLLQVVTGIWQLFYYVPTLAEGYNSLNYLRTEVPFGWLVHGLHYWGANAMVVLVMLHMSQVFIWGAYKRPHELQWITGVFLFLLTMAMSLTGGALPWDKRSYWLVEVASSSAGTVPIIGDMIKRTMLGGGVIGQLTLSRFFILHVAILSGGLMALAAIHLVALRKVGNAGPWDEKEREEKGPFWPDQVFKDGLAASLVILLLVALSVYAPPPFSGMADPLDASYIPKPEWNFLFFYEALKFFPGPLEVIATIGIPVGGTLLLLLIPFVDRRPGASSAPAARRHGRAGSSSWRRSSPSPLPGPTARPKGSRPGVQPHLHRVLRRQRFSRQMKRRGWPSLSLMDVPSATVLMARAVASDPIFPGKASKGAPASGSKTSSATRRPIIRQALCLPLRPSVIKRSTSWWIYLQSLKEKVAAAASAPAGAAAAATSPGPQGEPGMAVTIIGSAEHGAIIFAGTCSSCHGPQGTGGITNPGSKDGTIPLLNPIDRDEFSPDPKTFAEKIDLYIQHGSRPEGPNPQVSMLPFGDSNALTQQQIADLEAYILSLNGVDRAKINHPGLSPGTFFIITAFAFALVGLNLLRLVVVLGCR